MSQPILDVRGLVRRFGGLLATDHVDLTVERGEIHALIGPNGAGKTTLISQLMGELKPNEGSIAIDGKPVDGLPSAGRVALGLARTFQITCLLPDYTVRDNVAIAVQIRQGHSFRFWGNVRREKA
ncbi:ATP-binding cassette domain-containing protein, partial [Rhizobiaceae sp. 2RAB30]